MTAIEIPIKKQATIRIVAMPKDTNPGGSVFGGWIMSQVDIAGAIVAVERACGRVTTIAVNSMTFYQPVFVGDIISCYADVKKTGRTSITVEVNVYAERNPVNRETVKVTQAELTYVALDDTRKPRPIPEIE